MSGSIIRTYYAITGLFNLAMSLIWGIDTLFKMHAGLDIQQVLLTNAAFTLGSMVFEIPTGVIADTVGRRVSLLLCLVTLFITVRSVARSRAFYSEVLGGQVVTCGTPTAT